MGISSDTSSGMQSKTKSTMVDQKGRIIVASAATDQGNRFDTHQFNTQIHNQKQYVIST